MIHKIPMVHGYKGCIADGLAEQDAALKSLIKLYELRPLCRKEL